LDRLVRIGAGTGGEEFDRIGLGERQHLVLDLTSDPEALATGREQAQVGATFD